MDNYSAMNFSIEIGPHADLETLPPLKDVYVTLLPGGDYVETAQKAGELVKKGFNPVPHFPARSIVDEAQLNDYVSICKDLGVKQALVIGGSREPLSVRVCLLSTDPIHKPVYKDILNDFLLLL